MKSLFLMLCLALFGFVAVQAQCGSTVALSGCVGACGSSYSASYTVTPADMGGARVKLFCLAATSNSLCPNEVSIGTLTRNGSASSTAVLSQGGVASLKARAGDVLTVTVVLGPGDPGIVCFWQGETHFALTH